jgi:Spy/CpxP family protein refolding chaperone
MMKTLALAAALTLAAPIAAQTAAPAATSGVSQADIDLLRRDVAAARKEIVAQNLTLTPDEAARFWPVYDQYATEMGKVSAERAAVIRDYAAAWGKIDDKTADSLTNRSLAVDVKTAQTRKAWLPRFEKVLPATKVATFMQIDRRLSTLIDLQLAANLPLVQDQSR